MNALVVLYANSTSVLQENCFCATAMNFILSTALIVGSFSMYTQWA